MSSHGRYLVSGIMTLAAALGGATQALAAAPTRLLLQQVSPHGAIVKWRGDGDAVCYATKLKDLQKPTWPRCVPAEEQEGHKVARLAGLAPKKVYYYAVGDTMGEDYKFRTPPVSNKPPGDGNTRLWLVGDSGTATEGPQYAGQAAAVAEGFRKFVKASRNEPADLFLLLGDNAYTTGTDTLWQGAFFDIYQDILRQTQVLPTIGNHEMGSGQLDLCWLVPSRPCGTFITTGGVSISSDQASYDGNSDGVPDGTGMPYLSIFTLPTAGEAGGVPSGTEQYYSVDYANVHVVSLDTQLSARDPAELAAMRDWLVADLSANKRDWTVVIFHHPPYTKGANHDSDQANKSPIDMPEWDMRTQFTPIFEQYGVDVVYSGHSHSYERSYYLRGHTGTSDTFSVGKYAELNASGAGALGKGADGPYSQRSKTSGGLDDRVVYTVAGSSGKADTSSGAVTPPDQWMQHPAHIPQQSDPQGRRGMTALGSVVLDAGKKTLTSRFIDTEGRVLDEFTIKR